ncbi:hypothetical protein SAY87_006149 [Trapa incisa]|uniref:Uncharacterized protein n=1 Tax=Trapa incisa TaxID=236973 RepID=A0AAN7KBU1_9MYRT|nr:hypothetical protein SAY87_006149 [Trapa incisa]
MTLLASCQAHPGMVNQVIWQGLQCKEVLRFWFLAWIPQILTCSSNQVEARKVLTALQVAARRNGAPSLDACNSLLPLTEKNKLHELTTLTILIHDICKFISVMNNFELCIF